MGTSSLNAVFGIWSKKNGVPHVILVPAKPKDLIYGKDIQNKVPGGGAEGTENGIRAGCREIEEEVGIRMKRRFKPQRLARVSVPGRRGNHVKEGYAIHRSAFRGRMRTETIEDNDSTLYPPIEVPLDEALKIVFKTDKNKFHYNFLLELKKYIEQKGKRSSGPALAA